MEGSSQEALGNTLVFKQITLFKVHPYSSTDAGAFSYLFLCVKQTAYIDFMHVHCLTLQKIGTPLNICEITIVECVFSCLKSSAGNQYHAKKRAVNSMSCDVN